MQAAESKKAINVRVLDLRELSSSFTDFFIICSGSNPRQLQAICDEIQAKLAEEGEFPINVEGYNNAEWILADYADFVIHIFSEKARSFYDLERLWRQGKDIEIPQVALSA